MSSKAFMVVREREVLTGTSFQPYFYFYVLSLISYGRWKKVRAMDYDSSGRTGLVHVSISPVVGELAMLGVRSEGS